MQAACTLSCRTAGPCSTFHLPACRRTRRAWRCRTRLSSAALPASASSWSRVRGASLLVPCFSRLFIMALGEGLLGSRTVAWHTHRHTWALESNAEPPARLPRPLQATTSRRRRAWGARSGFCRAASRAAPAAPPACRAAAAPRCQVGRAGGSPCGTCGHHRVAAGRSPAHCCAMHIMPGACPRLLPHPASAAEAAPAPRSGFSILLIPMLAYYPFSFLLHKNRRRV